MQGSEHAWHCSFESYKMNNSNGEGSAITFSQGNLTNDNLLSIYQWNLITLVKTSIVELSAQQRHEPFAVGSEESTKFIRALQHHACEDRLRGLGMFSPEKRRLWQDLTAPSNTLMRSVRKTNLLAGCLAMAHRVMALNGRNASLD